jgi:hypothetical protein
MKKKTPTTVNDLFRINEASFQSTILELARLYGWHVHHTRAVQIRPGYWATPLQGVAGFPDLVLAKSPTARHRGGVIFAEIKTATGRLSDTQKEWLERLSLGGAEVYVWRPRDIASIRERLEGKL